MAGAACRSCRAAGLRHSSPTGTWLSGLPASAETRCSEARSRHGEALACVLPGGSRSEPREAVCAHGELLSASCLGAEPNSQR